MTGVYYLKPTIFKMTEQPQPSWRAELEMTEAIQKLIESPDHKVEYHILMGEWFDCGTFDSLLEAGLFMNERMRGR